MVKSPKNHPRVVFGNNFGNKGVVSLQTLVKPIDLAETRRFELPIQGLARCSLSRGVPSTTRPRLRNTLKLQVCYSNGFIENPQGISTTHLQSQLPVTSVQVQKPYVMP